MARGKHRGTAGINWRGEWLWLRNQWHYFKKPRLIALLKGLTK